MNIVILAGGTGSIALQNGLNFFTKDLEGINIKVIVNAYDNGLSTGLVRKVMGGNILGPSDVRKNQTTIYKNSQPEQCVLSFLDHRFTCEAWAARDYCLEKLDELQKVCSPRVDRRLDYIKDGINKYFSTPGAYLIDYNDFSLANIVYAGLAAEYNNSLRKAASIMADFLAIKDNVLVNDDASLFLGAITKSGKRIADEGDIVSWNNPHDPIVDVFFVDAKGQEDKPFLNAESYQAILDADVIIMSCGTQWSSLIPTYASERFIDAINDSTAKVLMVMNQVPDKDAPDQNASDIIKTLVPKYFPKNRIELLLGNDAHEMMSTVDDAAKQLVKDVNTFKMGDPYWDTKDGKHNANALATAVLKTIFKDVLDAEAYVFDYDDTLVGRGNTFKSASLSNVQTIANGVKGKKFMICSGNTIKAINLPPANAWPDGYDNLPITVFADGGINEYAYDPISSSTEDQRKFEFVGCLDETARFDPKGPNSIENIISSMCAVGIPAAKIENRGDVIISIKPIDPEYRQVVLNLVKFICGKHFEVTATGRTTIEINKKAVRKDVALKEVMRRVSPTAKVVYIGDELDFGNDAPVRELAESNSHLICHAVKNPTDTALLFLALSNFSSNNT